MPSLQQDHVMAAADLLQRHWELAAAAVVAAASVLWRANSAGRKIVRIGLAAMEQVQAAAAAMDHLVREMDDLAHASSKFVPSHYVLELPSCFCQAVI